MGSDEQFTALGSSDAETEVGFQTSSTSIKKGAEISGNEKGIEGKGPAYGVLAIGIRGPGLIGVVGNDKEIPENQFEDTKATIGVVGRSSVPTTVNNVDNESIQMEFPKGAGVVGVSLEGIGVYGRSEDAHRSSIAGFHKNKGEAITGKSKGGIGVHGISENVGVAIDDSSVGVMGECTGKNPGVKGKSLGGIGVVGESLSEAGVSGSSDTNDAVQGHCKVAGRSGVWGDNTTKGFGVSGSSVGGTGVWGRDTNGGSGVLGTSDGGIGVLGQCRSLGTPTTGGKANHGVVGRTDGIGMSGVRGENIGIGGEGVFGKSQNGSGVRGECPEGQGITGQSQHGYGGMFEGGLAPIRLTPAVTNGPPTTGSHNIGEFFVDASGVLFFFTVPGVWKRVQLV
jgi:hypothetical protein